MSTQHIVGRLEIAQRLRSLADDMTEVATLMNYYGGLAEWARHGVELACASHIARGWADAIEAAQQEQTEGLGSEIPAYAGPDGGISGVARD